MYTLRKLYRCLPSQLEAEPLEAVLDDVMCMNAETQVANMPKA